MPTPGGEPPYARPRPGAALRPAVPDLVRRGRTAPSPLAQRRPTCPRSCRPSPARRPRPSTARRCGSRAGTSRRGRVMVAQSMEQVTDTQRTIVLGWLLIAPFLLGFVFVGAVDHRPARRGAHRGRPPPPAGVHRGRVARAAHAAVGDRGTHLAWPSRRSATPPGTAAPSGASTASPSGCAGCSRTCSGWPGSTPRPRRTPPSPWTSGVLAARPPTGSLPSRRRGASASTSTFRQRRCWSPRPRSSGPAGRRAGRQRVQVRARGRRPWTSRSPPMGSRATVTVDDSGPGIPEEDASASSTASTAPWRPPRRPAGAGLGLAIGDAIVRATGGRWTVGRSPAGGARVAVTWARASLG